MDKFQYKYRIPSARLQNWDYGSNASYFVTICTHNRVSYSGHTNNHKMVLSETGNIAQQYWLTIPTHFAFIELGAFVIMPNHVHGILIFNKPENRQTAATSEKWKPGTLGVIINQYKRVVTINARKINSDFAWQSRFHDHIIRNNQSFQRISNYIRNNPANWENDQFNPFPNNPGKS